MGWGDPNRFVPGMQQHLEAQSTVQELDRVAATSKQLSVKIHGLGSKLPNVLGKSSCTKARQPPSDQSSTFTSGPCTKPGQDL